MDAHEKNQYLAGMLNVIQHEQEALVELSNMEKQGEKWQVTQTHPNPRHGMRLKRNAGLRMKASGKVVFFKVVLHNGVLDSTEHHPNVLRVLHPQGMQEGRKERRERKK